MYYDNLGLTVMFINLGNVRQLFAEEEEVCRHLFPLCLALHVRTLFSYQSNILTLSLIFSCVDYPESVVVESFDL